jgi:hypothetical protein
MIELLTLLHQKQRLEWVRLWFQRISSSSPCDPPLGPLQQLLCSRHDNKHTRHTQKKTLKLKHLTQKKKKKASKTLNPFWLRRRRKNKDSMGKYLIHYVNRLQGYKILFKANPSRKGQFGIMPNFCKSRSSIHCPLIIPNNYVDLEWLCEILPHCIYVVWRWFNRDMMWICFSHFGIQRDFVFQCFVNDLGILSIY